MGGTDQASGLQGQGAALACALLDDYFAAGGRSIDTALYVRSVNSINAASNISSLLATEDR